MSCAVLTPSSKPNCTSRITMPSPQLQDWLSTFDRLEAFFVNAVARPHLESFFAGYQWPTEVREEDVRVFLERWEEHWRQISAHTTSNGAKCMFHTPGAVLSPSVLTPGQSRNAVPDSWGESHRATCYTSQLHSYHRPVLFCFFAEAFTRFFSFHPRDLLNFGNGW